jgi:hypothetical protein
VHGLPVLPFGKDAIEAGDLGGGQDRSPTDSVRPAIIGIEPQLAHETVEQVFRHLTLGRKQGCPCTQVGRTGKGTPLDRRAYLLRLAIDHGDAPLILAPFDGVDAHHGNRHYHEEYQNRDRARVIDQPSPAPAPAFEFFGNQCPVP